MKYTKKQIADEYNCMISVNGPYPEGNAKIKDALIKAEEEIDRRSVSCQINNRRREIINEAYDILTTSQAAASRENGKLGGRPGKQYTIDDIEKLSDRQLRKLIEKTDRMCVIVNYHHPEKTYLPELRCADIPAHTETVLESLHQHVRDEQLRRSNQ
jgi:hypothetical protein